MTHETQFGIDTLSFYHSVSSKQKRIILEQIQKLPKFQTITDKYFNESYEYASNYFESSGVKLHVFQKNGSVWGLFVIVHPALVLGDDDRSALYHPKKSNYNKMVKLVDKMLQMVGVPFSLDDMPLYRADITANIIFDDDKLISEYIRVLKKSVLLPCYKRHWFRDKEHKAKDCNLANRHSYKQYCNSAAFFVYDKTAQLEMTNHFPNTLIGKKVLRLEAQLRRQALKKWVSGKKLGRNWQIVHDTYKKRKRIIKWYLDRLQPVNRIVRYADAVNRVEAAKMKKKTCDRMLYLLRKTSDKDSLTAALESMQKKFGLSKSQCKTVLKKYQKLEISPITLPNSSEFEELCPLI